MNKPELIHQVREAAAGIAWTVAALEAACRSQPDDQNVTRALQEATSDAASLKRRIANASKWVGA